MHTKHIFVNVKPGGTYSNHWALLPVPRSEHTQTRL